MYEIENINKFAKCLGKKVAKECGFSPEQLKTSITVKNVCGLIMERSFLDNDGTRYIKKEDTSAVCEEILNWILGVNLARLAAEDEVDCYWSDKKNCMVFSFKESS